ncbi:MAG: molybdenum cofactor biosynthesis protein MoaE [Vicinamibacterales bacterium]
MAPRFAVSQEALDPHQVSASIADAEGSRQPRGAMMTFSGVVRGTNQRHQVLRLEYEGYEPMILKVFEQIGAEIEQAWPGTACAMHHRLGTLRIGEISIVIATGSAHRAAAYAASRYAIERVKQIAPIWKHEYFEGGDVWIEGAVAAADDEAAKKRAMEAACA